MQVIETLSEGLKRAFTVVLPAAELESKRAARIAELGKTLQLPGFRPGKVPLSLIRQRFGSAVAAEVLQESVDEATREVISSHGLRPAVQPKIELQGAESDEDVTFSLALEVLPEIPLPDFSTISLTRLKATPTEEAVEKALATFARRQLKLERPAEPRPSRAGDVLTIDFSGSVDGVPVEALKGSDINVEVGQSEDFPIPGFAEQLEGLGEGETRTVTVTLPENYPLKEAAGKTVLFEVTVKALREPLLPALDDAFAQEFGFENLAELREAIRRQIQREYDQMSRLRLKRALLDALAARADYPVPETLVEAEFAQIWARVEADRAAGRLDEEDRNKDEAALRESYRAIAERRVRLGLLLAEVGRANNITVSKEEIGRLAWAEASRFPGQEGKVLELFRKNPDMLEALRGPLYEDKVIDFILELVKPAEQEVTAEELKALLERETV